MATQGKCITCKKRFVWKSDLQLSLTACPCCNGFLSRTSYLFTRWPTVELTLPPRRYNVKYRRSSFKMSDR